MITREELRLIPKMHRDIQRDREQLLYLREKATSIPSILPDPNKVQTSPTNNANKYSDAAVDLDREICVREGELKALISKAAEFIEALPTTSRTEILAKKIMRYRYEDCLMWSEIADLMGYDIIYTQRLAKTAEILLPE